MNTKQLSAVFLQHDFHDDSVIISFDREVSCDSQRFDLWKKIFPRKCSPLSLAPAFIHSSYVHERKSAEKLSSNERIEFLGDAVIDLLVSQDLIERMPESPEGELSQWRSSVVNERGLAELSAFLELPQFILLGKGEFANGGSKRPSIQSDLIEACMGQVCVSFGIDGSRTCWDRWLALYQKHHKVDFYESQREKNVDYKSRLQEICMANQLSMPRYTIETYQKAGREFFVGQASVGTVSKGPIQGSSKKNIQKQLAKSLYQHLQDTYGT